MCTLRWAGVLILTLGSVLPKPVAMAEESRRGALKTPGLIIETRAPTAPCNALTFTPDGKWLLAAGADKVVRGWRLEGSRLVEDKVVTLRWATWREQRGVIGALALSPDPDTKYVAIGGYGLITGTIAIIDRQTKEVVHALTAPGSGDVVTAMGFSPSGKRLLYGTASGTTWVWNLNGKKNDLVQLGQTTDVVENRVRLAAFISEQEAVTVARDGTAERWFLGANVPVRRTSFRFDIGDVACATFSAAGRWVAAASQGTTSGRSIVELRTIDGTKITGVSLAQGTHACRLAVDTGGTVLAIAADIASERPLPYQPLRSTVLVYDLKEKTFRDFRAKCSYMVDAVAIHPDGKHLAVAGGDDFEVAMWNVESGLRESEIHGPGRSVWGTAFSADHSCFGFRNERNTDPQGYNDWGSGPWRVFDLGRRHWAVAPEQFTPILPMETVNGWRVKPDAHSVYRWQVVDPEGREYDLPFDRFVEVLPRCYTFIRPVGARPPRLAVGHRWGISLYELGPAGPRRVRIFVGHADDVISLAVSTDQKSLLSGSRDQTLACWSLDDWPHQSELGASFTDQANQLHVQEVAPGSPAWEAGLSPGDQILFLAVGGRPVEGCPKICLDRLRHPEPGKELFFRVQTPGKQSPVEMLTTVRQRPVWKFFATREGEWVLWRWRDYYYDTSAKGDFYIGWEIIESVEATPQFYEAEKFRRLFHRPDKVAMALAESKPVWERIAIPDMLPPKIDIAVSPFQPEKDTIAVEVRVAPRVETKPAQPNELAVWLNDFQIKPWVPIGQQATHTVKVARSQLRSGVNSIVAQVRNVAGVREDSRPVEIPQQPKAQRPRIYGLFAGVQDYSGVVMGATRRDTVANLLYPVDDAKAVSEVWKQQGKTNLYDGSKCNVLLDKAVRRETLVKFIGQISKNVAPDDLFVLFLAGHGYAKQHRNNVVEPETFTFVCPNFDIRRPYATGLHCAELSSALAMVPCRKLILLDCCHSGCTSVVRGLTPDAIGPVIITACGENEESYDIPYLGHGAFSNALVEALGDRFSSADVDKDSKLTIGELYHYVLQRVQKTVALSRPVVGENAVQTPQAFFPRASMKDQPIAGKF